MYQGTLAAASNRADWIVDFEVSDPNTDELIDLTGALITLWVTLAERPQDQIFSGSTQSGQIVITGTGTFTASFSPGVMGQLSAGEHRVFVRIVQSGITTQLLAADLPVIHGGPQ